MTKLNMEQRIQLRNLLFDKLKELKVISYSNKSKTYRITNPNKFQLVLNNNPSLKDQYNLYIDQFRTEREARYCLARQDDYTNHLCPICNQPNVFFVNNSHINYQKTCGNVKCIESLANSQEALQKGINTCRKKYGCDHPLQNKDIMNNMIQTNINKRGVPYSVIDPIVKDKIDQVIQDKYNVKNVSNLSYIREKIRKSNIIYRNPIDSIKHDQLIRFLNKFNKIYNININIYDIYSIDAYFIKFIKHVHKIKKRMLKLKEIIKVLGYGKCNSIKYRIEKLNLLEYFDIIDSELELKFKKLLESNELIQNKDFIRKDRKILCHNQKIQEIDFYLPQYKIGFEINDILTHNCKKKDKFYHINKTSQCLNKNIILIHIWEWELTNEKLWNKLSLWIKNFLNNQKIEIKIEDCKINYVNQNEEQEFINKYNINEYIQSTICYGLYYHNELIELMSFNNKNDDNKWELLQFCTKYNYYINNSAKTIILNQFIKENNPESIEFRCNLDKFIIDEKLLCDELGFKLLKQTDPILIKDQNNNFNNSLYKSIYDCGQKIFMIKFDF